jgi:hypothetical protein
MRTGKARLSAT